jgi:bifunctional UDP-N-acetylglucosamine pyrophosphorylase/glucosamine-1-phosphate N-acetyltransferase
MFQCIVLAGGDGKRMKSNIPKVLHKIGNKTLLEMVLNKVIHLGARRVIVVSGKNRELFRDAMLYKVPNDKCEVVFIDQIPALGTAHAVKQCLKMLYYNAPTLIINADTPLIDDCLDEMLSYSRIPSIMVAQVDDPTGYGRVIQHGGIVRKIVEEKDTTESTKNIKLVNCGIYLVNSDTLTEVIPKIKNNNAQNEYYLTDLCSFVKFNYFCIPREKQYQLININTPDDLDRAKDFIKN